MAAFFCGVVRAPLTGIVLTTEMTGNVTMLLPMLGASFAAMLVPTLLHNAPIKSAKEAGFPATGCTDFNWHEHGISLRLLVNHIMRVPLLAHRERRNREQASGLTADSS
jgi:hypothetical protein